MGVQRIGILGTSGGVGASTLALGLARRASQTGLRVACVDGQWCSGGLDVMAGLEVHPGLRWADLSGVRGRLDGEELLAELPATNGVALLSVDRARPAMVGAAVVDPVLEALAEVVDVCILDLPRWGMPLAEVLAAYVQDVIVLGGDSAAALSGTAAVCSLLGEPSGRGWLVQRSPTPQEDVAQTVAELTGLPLLGVVPDDRAVPKALAGGEWPGGHDGPFMKACARLFTELRLQVVPS